MAAEVFLVKLNQCQPRSVSPYGFTRPQLVNWLVSGRCGRNLNSVTSQHMLWNKSMGTCEIALRWMPENTFHDKSSLVQIMVWCHQATSHYLSHCWPRSCRSVLWWHWGQRKWPTFCRPHFPSHVLEWKCYASILILNISLNFVPKGSINIQSTMVEVMDELNMH